jgi:serine phosphatase RsbU (regulator of sigma subunit)
VGLFNEATYEDHVLELPPTFSLTLMSDGILDLLPEPTQRKRSRCPNGSSRRAAAWMVCVFGLATLGEMPDDIALLVLSRNLQ